MVEAVRAIDNPALFSVLANLFVADSNRHHIINPAQCMLDWFRNGEQLDLAELAIQGKFSFQPGFFVNGQPFGFTAEIKQVFEASHQHLPMRSALYRQSLYKLCESIMMADMDGLEGRLAKLLMTTAHQSGLFGFIGQILLYLMQDYQITYSVQARHKSINMRNFYSLQLKEEALLYHRSNFQGEAYLTNFVLSVAVVVEFHQGSLPSFSKWQISIRYDDVMSCSSGEEIVLRNLLEKLSALKRRQLPLAPTGFLRCINTEILKILQGAPANNDMVTMSSFQEEPQSPKQYHGLRIGPTPPRQPTAPRKHRSQAFMDKKLEQPFHPGRQLFTNENTPPNYRP